MTNLPSRITNHQSRLEGVLVALKPPGMTSHDVVDYVRKIACTRRVGHAGSLDPSAAGVLLVCIGRATRITEYLMDLDKTYRAEMVLGIRTSTQDREGKVISTQPTPDLTMEKLKAVLSTFVGTIEQTPPMLSAVRHQGKHLYELARKGMEVERQPRKVTIHRLQLVRFYDEEPKRALMEIECSRGTYVRTLCADIGDKLGCGAYLSFLVRTAIGPFGVNECATLEEVQQAAETGRLARFLLPVDEALPFFPALPISRHEAQRLLSGLTISLGSSTRADQMSSGQLVRVYAPGPTFVAIGCLFRQGAAWHCKPEKVFA